MAKDCLIESSPDKNRRICPHQWRGALGEQQSGRVSRRCFGYAEHAPANFRTYFQQFAHRGSDPNPAERQSAYTQGAISCRFDWPTLELFRHEGEIFVLLFTQKTKKPMISANHKGFRDQSFTGLPAGVIRPVARGRQGRLPDLS
jgi:hypothetical protein